MRLSPGADRPQHRPQGLAFLGEHADHSCWPGIFFVNLPVGLVAISLTFAFVPDFSNAGVRRQADFLGVGLLAMGLGSLQFVLERGEHDDWWDSGLIRGLMVSPVLGMAAYLWWELQAHNRAPAVDVRLLLNRNLALGSLFGAPLGFLLYGSIFAVPLFLQGVQAHPAQQTGVLLIPGGLATALGMAVVGRLTGRLDARRMVGGGMVAFAASPLLFATRLTLGTPDEAFIDVFWVLAGQGVLGAVLFRQPRTTGAPIDVH